MVSALTLHLNHHLFDSQWSFCMKFTCQCVPGSLCEFLIGSRLSSDLVVCESEGTVETQACSTPLSVSRFVIGCRMIWVGISSGPAALWNRSPAQLWYYLFYHNDFITVLQILSTTLHPLWKTPPTPPLQSFYFVLNGSQQPALEPINTGQILEYFRRAQSKCVHVWNISSDAHLMINETQQQRYGFVPVRH